jgi:predicted TIM-barrel fold metal-dependent hydrolase
MDENGLSMMVNLSGGNTVRRFRRMKQMSDQAGGRIVHFYTPRFSEIGEPDWAVTQADLLRVAVQSYGYRGLKIPKVLGLGARWDSGVPVSIDDPELEALWDMAGALGVPVAIHTADPRAFWEPMGPQNERDQELSLHPNWSYHERWKSGEVPSWSELLDAFEELVRKHSATTFIGVHFGNAPEEIDRVERMLTMYPNFYVDIAARVGEIGRHDPRRIRRLFEKFADRILFGTDIGISPYGIMLGAPGVKPSTFSDIKPFFDLHWRWLETNDSPMAHPVPIQGNWPVHGIDLPDKILRKIYRENAMRILGLNRLPR